MKKIDFATLSIKELAGLITDKLRSNGIDCTLVGGACVTIYARNLYQSYDLDFVVYDDMQAVTRALKELGYHKKGKYYIHPETKLFIDFVAPPIAIGNEYIDQFTNIKTPYGDIKLLTPEDCIKDRLAGYFHWDDHESLEQAVLVYNEKKKEVSLPKLKKWAKGEEMISKYKDFERLIKSAS